MTAQTDNPYQPPQTVSAESSSPATASEVNWKSILKRWEILRLPYNLVVGLAGLLALAMIPFSPSTIGGAIIYGLCANVMYLLGPITELYLTWFVDVWESRLLPRWMAGFVRSRYVTAILFVVGTLFSVAVTLAIGLGEAFAAAIPDQQ